VGLSAESVLGVEVCIRPKRPFQPTIKRGITISMTKKNTEHLLLQLMAVPDSSPANSYVAVFAFFNRQWNTARTTFILSLLTARWKLVYLEPVLGRAAE
jgi:hypothetical protein